MKMNLHALVGLLVAALSSTTYAQETKVLRSQLKDQTAVSLTVYSNGRSMIRDFRRVKFDKGFAALELQDVSSQMLSETAQLRNVNAPDDLLVLEQNLEFDLLSPTKLLEKFLGRNVSVTRTHPTNGSESSESAEVLSTQNGVVLKMKDRIETGVPGRISFPEVPKNLRAEPTLSLLVESRKSGEQDLELNYLSGGITWKADYIADLNENEDKINLTGFVTLTNQSGTAFRNAKLQLMAGSIQTVEEPRAYRRAKMNYAETAVDAMPMSAAAPQMQGESFFEYHLYTLPRATTISSNQTKQLTLLQVANVPTRKEIIFEASSGYYLNDLDGGEEEEGAGGVTDNVELGNPIPGGVFIAFENDKQSRLGMALPAGIVRVYKRDKATLSQFLGEDKIRHVPENERVRVRLGTSFDVTARKRQLSYKNLPTIREQRKEVRVVEFTNRVVFSNAKDREQQVIYREGLPGDAKILKTTFEQKMLGKGTAEWRTVIPAKGKRVLEYTVRAKIY